MANFGNEHESTLKKEIVKGLIQLLDSHNALVQLFHTARNKYMEAEIPEIKVRLYNVIGTRQYELPITKTIGVIVFVETSDRADIVDRVFEKKVHDYIAFVRDSNTCGHVTAVLYTIEFQKGGLPHCHSLLWIYTTSKVNQAIDVDLYVSAELPDPKVDANRHRIISELMIHGPYPAEAQKQCIYQFLTWLLDIGDGNIGTPDESETKDIFNVHIHVHLCILDSDMALTELINFIYDDMALQTPTVKDLQKKVIVAPTNESADMINVHVLSLVNHQQRIYLSSDEAIPHGNDGGETKELYPTEYLNSLNFSGFPPHMLQLKVGAPIILLRNLNIAAGLCNGTRLIVTQLLDKVIEARIITRTRTKMIEPNNPVPNQIDKGKLPLVEATTVRIADIKPT
nr:DNA helicase [Tanacetum cinerariifolium]